LPGLYAIREVFVTSFNQMQTTISAKTYNRAKASLANFAAAFKAPALVAA